MFLPECVEMNSPNAVDVGFNQVVSMIGTDCIWLWENKRMARRPSGTTPSI